MNVTNNYQLEQLGSTHWPLSSGAQELCFHHARPSIDPRAPQSSRQAIRGTADNSICLLLVDSSPPGDSTSYGLRSMPSSNAGYHQGFADFSCQPYILAHLHFPLPQEHHAQSKHVLVFSGNWFQYKLLLTPRNLFLLFFKPAGHEYVYKQCNLWEAEFSSPGADFNLMHDVNSNLA